MSELALEARLERFSQSYLSSPSPPLDERATAQMRSMLDDAGYQRIPWKHPQHFYARQTQSSAIDLFLEYNVLEKKEGFSYLRAENILGMREFEKIYEAWLRPKPDVLFNGLYGAALGFVSSIILTTGIAALTVELDKPQFPPWAYGTMFIPAAVGTAIGYFPSRAKAERKAEQDAAFIQKYKPALATDKEAILKALAAA